MSALAAFAEAELWTSDLGGASALAETGAAIGVSGSIAFGTMVTGTTASLSMTIRNSGIAPLAVTNITYPPAFSGALTSYVAAGQTKSISVAFAPQSALPYSGTITVWSTASYGTNTLVCSGTGMAARVHYVNVQSANPLAPYTNWSTAAQTIQAAVDQCTAGDVVLVTNGVYESGSRISPFDELSNRVVITQSILVKSVNGPEVTVIRGSGPIGRSALRCVLMSSGTLQGFSLVDGHTGDTNDNCGGGVNAFFGGTLSDCVLASNVAAGAGGGACGGVLSNCTLVGNSAVDSGGGSYYCDMTGCLLENNGTANYGGGAYGGVLSNCVLRGNAAYNGAGAADAELFDCHLEANSTTNGRGGGALGCRLDRCAVQGNRGGGVDSCRLYACTLSSNWSYGATFSYLTNCVVSGHAGLGMDYGFARNTVIRDNGGGVQFTTLRNCTVIYNRGAGTSYGGDIRNSILYYNGGNNVQGTTNVAWCCLYPDIAGAGNITNAPGFVSADGHHLATNAPCVAAGSALHSAGLDIDGDAWRDLPSIGADEPHGEQLVGMLSVSASAVHTQVAVGGVAMMVGTTSGKVAGIAWEFGDGTAVSNVATIGHAWSVTGIWQVTFRAWNTSYPDGVATTARVEVIDRSAFVAPGGGHVPPFDTWANAATDIQSALDVATLPGMTIWVSNGTYASGGRIAVGLLTNRVAVMNPVSVRSVNGPEATIIQGAPDPGMTNGNAAVRCVYLGANARLSGFKLLGGFTRATSIGGIYEDLVGGGVLCADSSACLSNCILEANVRGGSYRGTIVNSLYIGNRAYQGGGASHGTLWNCTLTENDAIGGGGGGAAFCSLQNCTLRGNRALNGLNGGGTFSSILRNCTVVGNYSSRVGGGSSGDELFNCIVYDNIGGNIDNNKAALFTCTHPGIAGIGNITNAPALISASHLSSRSPCVGAGHAAYAIGCDVDGEPWKAEPSMGADEPWVADNSGTASVGISAAYTRVAQGFLLDLMSVVSGRVAEVAWDFGDGMSLTNLGLARHSWDATGTWAVVLRAWNGQGVEVSAATVRVEVLRREAFVAAGGTHVPPFSSWGTAATNIQAAVDAADLPGMVIWVTNGLYATGSRAVDGLLANRLVATNPVAVQSVNGPTVTTIEGAEDSYATNGPGAVRAVYLGGRSRLSGFRIARGHTRSSTSGGTDIDLHGGGIVCEFAGAVVSNCILTQNGAWSFGGGCLGGQIFDSLLTANQAQAGAGSYYSDLTRCTISSNRGDGVRYGSLRGCKLVANSGAGVWSSSLEDCELLDNGAGGALQSTLRNCLLQGNHGSSQGAGAASCTLWNSRLISNRSDGSGGGGYDCTLYSCLLTGNTSSNEAGGAWQCTLRNCTVFGNASLLEAGGIKYGSAEGCIVFSNAAPSSPNHLNALLAYTCTMPLPTNGMGNITNEPEFFDPSSSNFTLRPMSPCIEAGVNQVWMTNATDLAGRSRVMNGRVDMGAHEFAFEGTLRVGLANAYTGAMMRAAPPGAIRPISPYAADARPVALVPSNVVDWVLVSVRTNPAAAASFSRSYFLRTDGVVVDENGGSNLLFEAARPQYLVVQHRNCLAIASPAAVLTNRLFSYDFTTAPGKYLGGSNAAVEASPGIWAMRAGDVDGDGEVGPADLLIWHTQEGK